MIAVGRRDAGDRLRAALADSDRRDDRSAWSVGMHVEHCALATIAVVAALRGSAGPMPARRRIAPLRFLVLRLGRIPRGRAQAPKIVIPRADRSDAERRGLLDRAEAARREAAALPRESWLAHPALGPLTRDETLRFLAVHDRHHLATIERICRADSRG